jgi:hypothetical protein
MFDYCNKIRPEMGTPLLRDLSAKRRTLLRDLTAKSVSKCALRDLIANDTSVL